jgi:hypothetical protein
MLTSLEVINPKVLSPTITYTSDRISNDPIQILDVKGLGPVAASISSTPYGLVDGETYTGASVGKRNIVLTVGFKQDSYSSRSIDDLRRELYTYFMPKSFVQLRFKGTHIPELSIDAYVETCEVNHYSADPEVQVSLICPDPHFSSVIETSHTGSVVVLASSTLTTIHYPGTVPAGVRVNVTRTSGDHTGIFRLAAVSPAIQYFELQNTTVDATYGIEISSEVGNKYAKSFQMANPSITTSLLNKTVTNVDWIVLYPGLNDFAVRADFSGDVLNWTLTYKARYGGL